MQPDQQTAVKIADQVMAGLTLRPGLTEQEIADKIVSELKVRGAKPAFDVIVASGKRSIDPHGRPSGKKLKNGEQVVIDLGANYRGYCSDLTRTFFIGRLTKKFSRLYQLVKNAQAKAIKAVKTGVFCRQIDLVAREYIRRSCFAHCQIKEKLCGGDCFIHTTGHGVGRKIHQAPRISLKSREKLKVGMVITVEPGIYLKGWGGIRIEDMVLVTKTGCRVLTKAKK
ncbi:hypothetical protein COT42_06475 [Candidatus Saganbacteria bacterium CG08_land_8_20_14_0_20_45_16]|uniref:Peptidase M24 domain-containing protein n=1 Tax=Candidatus Saganbacteria bacterium CG08_land_8_20_14_0_20_45_16 TaxID=2014293 RepID=A0A2H0XW79_UNCSA|nr:MAG: hypothetical protein COT42_06475 [Candidatus Saganbacteria bacterium CG08_land_8_20_14_0_20_45_16]